MYIRFALELLFENSTKIILQLIAISGPRKGSIARGVCPPQESVTAQHLSGMDWIRL